MVNQTDPDESGTTPRRRNTKLKGLGIALTASAFLAVSAIPAWAAEMMTVTFIRHAQSNGNLSGLIDTQTPGPVLTDGTSGNPADKNGVQQAKDIVKVLGLNNYDSIYASQMVRTQLTAGPMAQYLGLPINVLPGLQEIEAGKYENTLERSALGYISKPLAWSGMQITGADANGVPIMGQLTDAQVAAAMGTAIPGGADGTNVVRPDGPTGTQFDKRVDDALKAIYDNGDRNAAVFSHGGTIMFWTMMNAQNLTFAQKAELFPKLVLNNTNYVVVEGNPEEGWTLVNWNGKQYAPEKTFMAEVQTQVRTLTRQLTATWQKVAASLSSGDFSTIEAAITQGLADASFAVTKFSRAVTAQVVKQVDKIVATVKGWLTPGSTAAKSPAPVSVAATGVNDDPASATSMLKQLSAPVAAPSSAAPGDDPQPKAAVNEAKSDSKVDEAKVDTKADETKADVKVEIKADDTKPAKAAKADNKAKKNVRRAPQKAASAGASKAPAHASAGGDS